MHQSSRSRIDEILPGISKLKCPAVSVVHVELQKARGLLRQCAARTHCIKSKQLVTGNCGPPTSEEKSREYRYAIAAINAKVSGLAEIIRGPLIRNIVFDSCIVKLACRHAPKAITREGLICIDRRGCSGWDICTLPLAVL